MTNKKIFVIIYAFLSALNNRFLFLETLIIVFLNIFKHNTTSLNDYNGKDVEKKKSLVLEQKEVVLNK